jgi:hypothetical protein
MGWTEVVHDVRREEARHNPALQPTSRCSPRPARSNNAGLATVAAAAALCAGLVWWRKEGHKLQGRQLPLIGSLLRRRGDGGGGGAGQQRARPSGWKQQRPGAMAAAAAAERAGQATSVQVPWQGEAYCPRGLGGGERAALEARSPTDLPAPTPQASTSGGGAGGKPKPKQKNKKKKGKR